MKPLKILELFAGVGANSMSKNVTAPIAQAFDTIKKATGLDLVDVIQKTC